MKIVACYDHSGPKLHRILMPVHLMEAVDVKVVHIPTDEDLQGCDILFFNRMIPNMKVEDLTAAREKYGFKIVCDLDDHWILGPDHLLYATYKHYKISDIIELFIKASDIITVTHERLYKEAVRLNPNVHILPNAIARVDQFDIVKYPDPENLIRLFWAGGITHRKDLFILKSPALRMNCPQVRWVIGGYEKNSAEWTAMAATFTNGGQFKHDVIAALKVHEYYKVYCRCDISLVPLLDNRFNGFKSNLKILEAANVRAPVIVSRVHPYTGFPDSVVNYVDYQPDWNLHVRKMVNNPALIQDKGEALKEYCDKHYNFNTINSHRKQLFDDASEHRQTGKVPALVFDMAEYPNTSRGRTGEK